MKTGPSNREIRSGTRSSALSRGLFLLPVFICLPALLGGSGYAQSTGSQPSAATGSIGQDKLSELVDEVERGNWSSVDQIVTEAGPMRAVPILHDLFTTSQDVETKERIAGALVKLGDRNGVYFDFMLSLATEAIENDVPFPFRLEPEGTPIPKPQQDDPQDPDAALRQRVSPEFLVRAKGRGVSLNSAAEEAMYTFPGRLLQLGMTGDKRAVPVLRRGLSSPNIMIVVMAAQGWAELKDNESIPLIIDACERAPAAAMALRSFDDPRAQSVSQAFFAKLLDAEREQGAGQDKNSTADQPSQTK